MGSLIQCLTPYNKMYSPTQTLAKYINYQPSIKFIEDYIKLALGCENTLILFWFFNCLQRKSCLCYDERHGQEPAKVGREKDPIHTHRWTSWVV